MIQPVKKGKTNPVKKKKPKAKPTKKELIQKAKERSKRRHQKYGTSKLETKFAEEILDKLGYDYEYQYEAKDIKRFYDFIINLPYNGKILLEIDGDYYHSYGKEYEEMSPMQKKNHRVDEVKNKWAENNHIPLIRIWEHDINKNSTEVLRDLKKIIKQYIEKLILIENKKQRH